MGIAGTELLFRFPNGMTNRLLGKDKEWRAEPRHQIINRNAFNMGADLVGKGNAPNGFMRPLCSATITGLW